MAASDSRAPFVFTSHDGAGLCGLPRKPIRVASDHIVMRCADALVALSEAERSYQAQHYGVKASVHAVIPNGIDTSIYCSSGAGAGDVSDKKVVLFVGQLIPLKRVDVLLRALSLLDDSVSLRLAYQVNHLERELCELAFRLGVHRRVEFLGPKEPSEVRDLYLSSDVLALPSEAESQPSVLSEALLCGLPIVASDLPGIREHAGQFAELVPPGDAAALAGALRRSFGKKSGLDGRIEAGRQYAIRRYSVEAMVKRHIEVYEAAIKAAERGKRNKLMPTPMQFVIGTSLRFL